jgi:hypothetical protein
MVDGLWHRVVKDKYLPFVYVATWFRTAQIIQPMASYFWKNLMKSLPLIIHWLSWKPGNGFSIHIGKDNILDIGNATKLSQDLLLALKTQNVSYLYQAKAQSSRGFVSDQWRTSEELGLSGTLALEWKTYIRDLICSGVQLRDGEDLILWTGGDHSGSLSTNNVYNALAQKLWPLQIDSWRKQLWKWDLAFKIKLFFWLALDSKILTWDSLQKRGWCGPSICPLCFREEESIPHLFIYCPFTIKLWQKLHTVYNLATIWGGISLTSCFEDWIKVEKCYKTLPIIVCWHVWLERNSCIFENRIPSELRACIKIRGMMNSTSCQMQTRTQTRIKKTPDFSGENLCWFDGAAQQNGTLCGAGGIIKTSG